MYTRRDSRKQSATLTMELSVRGAKLRVLMAAFATLTILILLTLFSKPSNSAPKLTVPLRSSGYEGTLTQPASSGGYIISKHFSGQQGASIRSVLSLQCWAASFSLPVRIVDPCVGIKNSSVTFSELIDIKHFNAVSQQASEPSVASWEEFSNNAPRDVILVITNVTRGQRCDSVHKAYDSEVDVDYLSDNKGKCLNQTHLEDWLAVQRKHDYCIKRVVNKLSVGCCSRSLNDYREMIDIIYRGRDVTKFTVVFTMWSARFECQNPGGSYRTNCSDPLKKKFKNKVTPSKQLLDDARYYTDHFLQSQNKVAVMIRSEQTLMRFRKHGDKIKFLRDCLQKTVTITHNISETGSHIDGRGILLTVDVGKFGTRTTNVVQNKLLGGMKEMTELVKHAFVNIYEDQWTFEDYEKSFTIASKGNESPAYIAALQRTLASQANCLILMGGGNFQLLALYDYLEKHPNPCVHFVCLDKYYDKVFSSAMEHHFT